MFEVVVNQSAIFPLNLILDSEYVTPDENSEVTYSILKMDGGVIEDFSDLQLEKPETGWGSVLKIPLPSELNAFDSESQSFTIRHVVARVLLKGIYHTFKSSYRVNEFPLYTATCDDVRNVFGLSVSELPDEKIDLNSQYFKLINEYGSVFKESFYGEGNLPFKANRILALSMALTFANALPLLAIQTESDGTDKIARFEKSINFASQIASAKSELGGLLDDINGVDSTSSLYDFFNIAETTDIFTGE